MKPPFSTNGAKIHTKARRINIYKKLSRIAVKLDSMKVSVGKAKLKWERSDDSDLELHIAELSVLVSAKMKLITTLIDESNQTPSN